MISENGVLTWSQLQSEIREIEGFTNKQRERISSGWHILEKIFGQSWLDEVKHPWISNFHRREPWIKSYYGIIGERIKDLAGIPGVSHIIDKLKITTDPVGVVGELNAGWKLLKNRVDFQYVEPTNPGKTADIRAKIDGREVAVEVTVLRTPKFQITQRMNLEQIWEVLKHPKICSSAKINRRLASLHTNHIIEQITKAIRKSLKENRPIEVDLRDDDVEFIVAPKEFENQVELWRKSHGLRANTALFSPDFYDGAGKKINHKIWKKMQQIGKDNPGVIYIEGFPFSVSSYGVTRSQYFKMSEIEEAVYEYNNLLIVVFNNLSISEELDRFQLARKATSQPQSFIATKNIAPYLSENTWLIMNRFHEWQTLRYKKIVRAFWHRSRTDPMDTWWRTIMKDESRRLDNPES